MWQLLSTSWPTSVNTIKKYGSIWTKNSTSITTFSHRIKINWGSGFITFRRITKISTKLRRIGSSSRQKRKKRCPYLLLLKPESRKLLIRISCWKILSIRRETLYNSWKTPWNCKRIHSESIWPLWVRVTSSRWRMKICINWLKLSKKTLLWNIHRRTMNTKTEWGRSTRTCKNISSPSISSQIHSSKNFSTHNLSSMNDNPYSNIIIYIIIKSPLKSMHIYRQSYT